MNHYKHFTIKDRELILELKSKDKSIRNIAKIMNRSPSSISRELLRNSDMNGKYSPSTAQYKYDERRVRCGPTIKLHNEIIRKFIINMILEHKWSPEQISNRLKFENSSISIRYSTIYRGINSGLLESDTKTRGERGIARKLRHRGKTRHKKGFVETRGKIRISNKLSSRPEVANKSERIGDWEAGTVLGVPGKECMVTLTDRKSRYLICEKIERKNSTNVMNSITKLLKDHPKYTITPDRGKEFSKHFEISKELDGVEFYFPPPSHPWERGTNENTNGLLREYFPKSVDMKLFDEDFINTKILELNKRPRKCLGWKSPYEVYFNEVLQLT